MKIWSIIEKEQREEGTYKQANTYLVLFCFLERKLGMRDGSDILYHLLPFVGFFCFVFVFIFCSIGV
jgi:hypothetical protein